MLFLAASGWYCNHGIAVYIINFEEIAYHQHEVLYIIKSKARYTPERDEIQRRRAAFDDIPTCVG